jgi:putative oxidoreductase
MRPVETDNTHASAASAARRSATFVTAYCRAGAMLQRLTPLPDLGFRLYVAKVFWMSGLTKTHDWSVTLALFTDEYHVPLLPPAVAAIAGTATELSMPVLLALGLGTRGAALVLFVFNIIAVISYPELTDAGIKDHMLWGTMLLVVLLHGPGVLSLDAWLARRVARRSSSR